jgi:hypothetical protein
MANRTERTFLPKESSYRVGDCYIWSEIQYLDSASEYRECLPQRIANRAPAEGVDDLVMLDTSSVCWSRVVALLLAMFAGLAGLGWLAYLAASSL